MKNIKYLFILLSLGLFSSCLKDDHIPKQVNETEVISDVTLTFTDSTGEESSYTYTDPKYREDQYTDPVIHLKNGRVYKVSAHFLDNSNPDDPEDVTEEVTEEKDDHFLEFRFFDTAVELNRIDGEETTDHQGIPIGLYTQWVPQSPGEGAVQITLIHKPESKEVTDPLGNHTGGETDAQVTFDLEITD